MLRSFIIFAIMLASLSINTLGTFAQDDGAKTERALAFVGELTQELYDLIENKEISEADKRAALSTLMTENVNIDALARILLAREHRQSATASQIERYDNLSKKYVLDLFVSRIGELGKRRLDIVDAMTSRRGDIIVRTHLRKKDGGIVDVDWRVRERNSALRVINFSANGVSLVVTKRSSIAQNEGFDALLKVMSESIEPSDANSQ